VDAQERHALRTALTEVMGQLHGVSEAVTHTWFTHVQEARSLRPLSQRGRA
jgi:hypothetical protein